MLMMVEAGEAVFPYNPPLPWEYDGTHIHINIHRFIISSLLWVCHFVCAGANRRRFYFQLCYCALWTRIHHDPKNPTVTIRSHLWSTVCIWSGDFLHVGKQCELREGWLFPPSKLFSKLPCVQTSPEYQCNCGTVHWLDSVRKHLRVFPVFCSLSRNNYLIYLSDKHPQVYKDTKYSTYPLTNAILPKCIYWKCICLITLSIQRQIKGCTYLKSLYHL